MRIICVLPGISAFALCLSAFAQTPATAPSSAPASEEEALETPFDILHNQRLTGDWRVARKWL